MARFWKWLKNIDYRNYICLAVVLGSLACAVFAFPKTGERLISGGTRFIDAGKSWVEFVFNVEFPQKNPPTSTPTVPDTPPADENVTPAPIPETPTEFADNWNAYWRLIGNRENAILYFSRSVEITIYALHIIFALVIVVLGIVYIKKKMIRPTVNNERGQTRPLKIWLRISKRIYESVKEWVLYFVYFVSVVGNGLWWKLTLLIWLYNFNLFGVALSFLAFSLKFDVTFSIIVTYRLVYEFFVDLTLFFSKLPRTVWIVLAMVLIDRLRKQRALQRLHVMERENLTFAKSLPLVVVFDGTIGSGKTSLTTDLSLTISAWLRNDVAKKKLLECELRFPAFPWQELTRILRHSIAQGKIRAWYSALKWLEKKKRRFDSEMCSERLFGYDYEKYGMTYNDGNHIWTLWEVLKIYVQMFFTYTLPSSLLIANYAIREDCVIRDKGNFPLWDTDFFNKSPELRDKQSMYAHILDQDILRPGKKVMPNNPFAGSFEFGVIDMTEAGKERQNDKETNDLKKNDTKANQKNDLWSLSLKMIRHPSTVDHFPFVRVLMDEQRAMSVDINARDLCTIGHIREKGAEGLAVRLLPPEKWTFQLFEDLFQAYRDDYVYRRGDTTLRKYLKTMIFGKIWQYFDRLKKRYGYHALLLETERGTMDGEKMKTTYYMMNTKAYADRFSTDCYSELYRTQAARSNKSILDYPTYRTVRASIEEVRQQHSYFGDGVLLSMSDENGTPSERNALQEPQGSNRQPVGGGNRGSGAGGSQDRTPPRRSTVGRGH